MNRATLIDSKKLSTTLYRDNIRNTMGNFLNKPLLLVESKCFFLETMDCFIEVSSSMINFLALLAI
jgi:hypothetical protein